ncbi:hypothetical protein BpHYR1_003426 [Brachionus plicatilis]|uniref:Uncharacterized protein n=1 Tax=Brachionus plicatilis TaxID=10195 RepID=A0A3M7QDC2_BRAPC|nr:hypothetical protein BpHYR1_003426 [Brachionus plicatilis]
MDKFLMLPSALRHEGQQVNLGRQFEQTMWPDWHCRMGGSANSKQTGHSNRLSKSCRGLDGWLDDIIGTGGTQRYGALWASPALLAAGLAGSAGCSRLQCRSGDRGADSSSTDDGGADDDCDDKLFM